MISDAEIASLCAGIYDPKAGLFLAHYDDGTDADGVCWGVHEADDASVVVFRGSVSVLDWMRDFNAWADPFHHDDLGPVHPGFLSGVRTVERELLTLVPKDQPIVVAGHSLGAARASVLSGLLTIDKRPPVARVVFGEPRPGFQQLADILKSVPGRSYRNGDGRDHDLITDVPFAIPPLEAYVHPTPLTDVSAPPAGVFASYGMFAYHHIELYVQAMKGLPDASQHA